VPELAGNREIGRVNAPQALADVDVAIVGVTETGSVLLSDSVGLGVNAVASRAQHLIVLLDPADIVVDLQHAYRRPEMLAHRPAAGAVYQPPLLTEIGSNSHDR
jgi:L-lactate dehydrogenase complex protein LldG